MVPTKILQSPGPELRKIQGVLPTGNRNPKVVSLLKGASLFMCGETDNLTCLRSIMINWFVRKQADPLD